MDAATVIQVLENEADPDRAWAQVATAPPECWADVGWHPIARRLHTRPTLSSALVLGVLRAGGRGLTWKNYAMLMVHPGLDAAAATALVAYLLDVVLATPQDQQGLRLTLQAAWRRGLDVPGATGTQLRAGAPAPGLQAWQAALDGWAPTHLPAGGAGVAARAAWAATQPARPIVAQGPDPFGYWVGVHAACTPAFWAWVWRLAHPEWTPGTAAAPATGSPATGSPVTGGGGAGPQGPTGPGEGARSAKAARAQ